MRPRRTAHNSPSRQSWCDKKLSHHYRPPSRTTQVTWNKPGAVEADFVRDRDQCKYETQRATVAMNSGAWQGIGTEIGAAIEKGQRQRELYNSCMTARGYQQQALAAQ